VYKPIQAILHGVGIEIKKHCLVVLSVVVINVFNNLKQEGPEGPGTLT